MQFLSQLTASREQHSLGMPMGHGQSIHLCPAQTLPTAKHKQPLLSMATGHPQTPHLGSKD